MYLLIPCILLVFNVIGYADASFKRCFGGSVQCLAGYKYVLDTIIIQDKEELKWTDYYPGKEVTFSVDTPLPVKTIKGVIDGPKKYAVELKQKGGIKKYETVEFATIEDAPVTLSDSTIDALLTDFFKKVETIDVKDGSKFVISAKSASMLFISTEHPNYKKPLLAKKYAVTIHDKYELAVIYKGKELSSVLKPEFPILLHVIDISKDKIVFVYKGVKTGSVTLYVEDVSENTSFKKKIKSAEFVQTGTVAQEEGAKPEDDIIKFLEDTTVVDFSQPEKLVVYAAGAETEIVFQKIAKIAQESYKGYAYPKELIFSATQLSKTQYLLEAAGVTTETYWLNIEPETGAIKAIKTLESKPSYLFPGITEKEAAELKQDLEQFDVMIQQATKAQEKDGKLHIFIGPKEIPLFSYDDEPQAKTVTKDHLFTYKLDPASVIVAGEAIKIAVPQTKPSVVMSFASEDYLKFDGAFKGAVSAGFKIDPKIKKGSSGEAWYDIKKVELPEFDATKYETDADAQFAAVVYSVLQKSTQLVYYADGTVTFASKDGKYKVSSQWIGLTKVEVPAEIIITKKRSLEKVVAQSDGPYVIQTAGEDSIFFMHTWAPTTTKWAVTEQYSESPVFVLSYHPGSVMTLLVSTRKTSTSYILHLVPGTERVSYVQRGIITGTTAGFDVLDKILLGASSVKLDPKAQTVTVSDSDYALIMTFAGVTPKVPHHPVISETVIYEIDKSTIRLDGVVKPLKGIGAGVPYYLEVFKSTFGRLRLVLHLRSITQFRVDYSEMDGWVAKVVKESTVPLPASSSQAEEATKLSDETTILGVLEGLRQVSFEKNGKISFYSHDGRAFMSVAFAPELSWAPQSGQPVSKYVVKKEADFPAALKRKCVILQYGFGTLKVTCDPLAGETASSTFHLEYSPETFRVKKLVTSSMQTKQLADLLEAATSIIVRVGAIDIHSSKRYTITFAEVGSITDFRQAESAPITGVVAGVSVAPEVFHL